MRCVDNEVEESPAILERLGKLKWGSDLKKKKN
jgi:hypothetical protein